MEAAERRLEEGAGTESHRSHRQGKNPTPPPLWEPAVHRARHICTSLHARCCPVLDRLSRMLSGGRETTHRPVRWDAESSVVERVGDGEARTPFRGRTRIGVGVRKKTERGKGRARGGLLPIMRAMMAFTYWETKWRGHEMK